VVEIQLHPASLGALTVTMRLSSAGLKVNVTASVRETAQRLDTDKAELNELIRRAGYDAAEISIEAASATDADAGGDGAAGEDRDRPARSESAEPPPAPAPTRPPAQTTTDGSSQLSSARSRSLKV
jgi:flagellar hook-length control protein FliK